MESPQVINTPVTLLLRPQNKGGSRKRVPSGRQTPCDHNGHKEIAAIAIEKPPCDQNGCSEVGDHVLATSKAISGRVLICEGVHSRQPFSAAPQGDHAVSTMS